MAPEAGTPIEESVQMCRWLEEAGVDYLHISAGGGFPHPRNPAGEFPAGAGREDVRHHALERRYTFRNYLTFRTPAARPRSSAGGGAADAGGAASRGSTCADARAVKQAVSVPVVVHRRVPDRLGDRRRDRAAATATASRSRGRSSPTPTSSATSRRGLDRAAAARARTATSASSTSSRTRSAATRRPASTHVRR